MYIIDGTYFKSLNREIPNLDEADSRSFSELERIIDEKCRLLLLDFLSVEQFQELDGYLVNGMFPTDTTGIPQKWIDLVIGVNYEVNDVNLVWNGLAYSKGTYKGSLLADYVYSFWLEGMASYMTGVGDAKANPKGANLVNPTQRYVTTWNKFVEQYQSDVCKNYYQPNFSFVWGLNYPWSFAYRNSEVSLLQFLSDKNDDYPNDNRKIFEVKNQLGL